MPTFSDPARHRAADKPRSTASDHPVELAGKLAVLSRRSATSVVVSGLIVSMLGVPASLAATPEESTSARSASTASSSVRHVRSLLYAGPHSSVPWASAWSFDNPAITLIADPPAPPAEPSTPAADAGSATDGATDPSVDEEAAPDLDAVDSANLDADSPDAAALAAEAAQYARDDAAALAAGTGGASALSAATATAGTRMPALHPFAVTAPANTSLGSGAKFEGAGSTKTAALLRGKPVINALSWSIAVAVAKSTDPIASIKNVKTGVVTKFRIPSGAQVTAGTDKNMTVVQPDGYTAYDCYKMTKVGTNSWTTTYMVQTDLRTSGITAGTRASGVSQAMGLIRAEEVANKKIPHTLAIAIPDSMLKSGQVWPARKQDTNAATAYKGPVPMGTMVGIPPSVNVNSLGLTPEGLALAHALQDYGAHVLDRAGMVALYAEPRSDDAAMTRMRTDWRKLFPLVRVVTNNTPTTVGGGGTRRAPAAAALAY